MGRRFNRRMPTLADRASTVRYKPREGNTIVSSAPETQAQVSPANHEGYRELDPGFGWVLFAGSLLLMLGTLRLR